ncbi:hypothetical protein ABT095_15150 [Kitasatospora sp. NPDC002227]|uniref:hypothetical protein n=1 Tax=Kitasatospora sp. NPDC002227 TaxID=3154773 RepID=UPI0033196793
MPATGRPFAVSSTVHVVPAFDPAGRAFTVTVSVEGREARALDGAPWTLGRPDDAVDEVDGFLLDAGFGGLTSRQMQLLERELIILRGGREAAELTQAEAQQPGRLHLF